MYLQQRFVPLSLQGLSVGRKNSGMAACHVKEIDALFQGNLYRLDNIFFFLFSHHGRTHADHTDLLLSMR